MKKVVIPKSEKAEREERIRDRKVNPKVNPTNREVMQAIQDLTDLVKEMG